VRGNFDYTSNKTVMDVIHQSAKRINRDYDRFSEYEDLVQECHIFLATKADLREAIEDENYGLLQYRLEADLKNLLDAEVRRTEKNISYDALVESAQDGAGEFLMSAVVIETASNDYSRESVESLLPAVWDDSFVYGLPQKDTAPDPDMPKGASNKAHANNLAAYIADIKFGWEKTPLTDRERRALVLAFGFGWTQREIAFNQGVDQGTISRRIDAGVGKVVARLNGGYYYDSEEAKAA
jgi:hypothetical protein